MNRFDIAEAHAVLEWDYNVSGILWERPSNKRRNESTGVQLSRMHFKARPNLSYETLEDDGKEVYLTNVIKWHLPIDAELKVIISEFFTPEFLEKSGHPEFQAVVV